MVPTTPLVLDNTSDNSSAIATAATNGGYYDMTLSNRTLWKDGAWNTLCLPFNADLIGDLADATLMELDVTGKYDTDKQTGLDADGTLYLYFKEALSIAVGKPYIIKWDSGSIIENPMFTGVTVSCDTTVCIESADGNVTFRGTYNAQTFTTDNRNILFLGGENRLYDPLNGAGIGACHAYFQLNNGLTAGDLPANGVKMFFGNGETGIASPKSSPEGKDFSRLLQKGTREAWYTLDGRRLSGKPAKKGVYIHCNTKVAIK